MVVIQRGPRDRIIRGRPAPGILIESLLGKFSGTLTLLLVLIIFFPPFVFRFRRFALRPRGLWRLRLWRFKLRPCGLFRIVPRVRFVNHPEFTFRGIASRRPGASGWPGLPGSERAGVRSRLDCFRARLQWR